MLTVAITSSTHGFNICQNTNHSVWFLTSTTMAMSSANTLVAIASATLAITSANQSITCSNNISYNCQFQLQTVIATSATLAITSAIVHTGPSGITSATNYTKSDNNICQSWTLHCEHNIISHKDDNNICQNVSNNINSQKAGNKICQNVAFFTSATLTITSGNKTNNHTIMAKYCHCWKIKSIQLTQF